MRKIIFLALLMHSLTLYSKEWKSLRIYQKETDKDTLSPSDWLKQDRKYNTLTWKQANLYNLENNKPFEYMSIEQRRDFYSWISDELQDKGHEVVWPRMAFFITRKLALTQVFMYSIFIRKDVREYSKWGSETVFRNAFIKLNAIFSSKDILKAEEALEWDKSILKEEQYYWIEKIYKSMDAKSLKTIERMAKGKGFYSFMVPKQIRFVGDISSPEERYDYAVDLLRDYCKEKYK